MDFTGDTQNSLDTVATGSTNFTRGNIEVHNLRVRVGLGENCVTQIVETNRGDPDLVVEQQRNSTT